MIHKVINATLRIWIFLVRESEKVTQVQLPTYIRIYRLSEKAILLQGVLGYEKMNLYIS